MRLLVNRRDGSRNFERCELLQSKQKKKQKGKRGKAENESLNNALRYGIIKVREHKNEIIKS